MVYYMYLHLAEFYGFHVNIPAVTWISVMGYNKGI